MPNAYTLEQVQAFIPGKTWNQLLLDMQMSTQAYAYAQQMPWYYLIVPPLRVDELAALVAGHDMQVVPVPLISGELVLPFDVAMDLDTFGYAHELLSDLVIRLLSESEFPTSDV